MSNALKVADSFTPGSGRFVLGAGVVDGVGALSADLNSRVSESVSLFANSHIDTNKQWSAIAGVKIDW